MSTMTLVKTCLGLALFGYLSDGATLLGYEDEYIQPPCDVLE